MQEHIQSAPAQRGGHAFQHRIDPGESRPRGDDQEWRGNEDLGDHDAGEGIRQCPVQQASDRACITDQEQQQDAAAERRQGERKLHDEAQHRHRAPRHARQQIAERNAAQRDEQGRYAGSGDRHGTGVQQRAGIDRLPIGQHHLLGSGEQWCHQVDREQPRKPRQRCGNAAESCVPPCHCGFDAWCPMLRYLQCCANSNAGAVRLPAIFHHEATKARREAASCLRGFVAQDAFGRRRRRGRSINGRARVLLDHSARRLQSVHRPQAPPITSR